VKIGFCPWSGMRFYDLAIFYFGGVTIGTIATILDLKGAPEL
jgi:hypothetical protein